MPLYSYPLHCCTLHTVTATSTAQQPSPRPPPPPTTSVPPSSPKIPAPQWSVRPQLATSCRLPPTSFYNACAQHQVVSVSPECCLHQPASHLIILAHHCPLQQLPKWSVCPLSNLVSANRLPLQNPHLGIALFIYRLSYLPTPTEPPLGDCTIQPFVHLFPTIPPAFNVSCQGSS
ncbi:hypothetical protein EV702DRAFT_1194115 [Suillus placidus]|uniref:Uncharacterized protein n=1 Tax=Suillus placidus TaxID=48579 RepID=A0A9P7A2N9_9AGAM|nr:hypothetical protein EV702DRAFT_1194115 [Suillus placidus]